MQLLAVMPEDYDHFKTAFAKFITEKWQKKNLKKAREILGHLVQISF